MTQTRQTVRPPLHSVLEAYTSVTDAIYQAKGGDRVVGVNRAGTVTITLPTDQVRPGRTYTVKDESGAAASNNITVATEGSETIDGSATDTIAEDYGGKTYYSDGANWFTLPLLANGAHQALHNSGGADAIKLDDLAAPEDNTDLDFSTSLHGLVPKGTNTVDFLKDDGTWSAPAASGAITREGGNTTEATTTSTSAANLLSLSSISIAAGTLFFFTLGGRKTSGAADDAATGLKINTTVTGEATGSGTRGWHSTTTDRAENGMLNHYVGPRVTNYDTSTSGEYEVKNASTGASVGGGGLQGGTQEALIPIAIITDIIMRSITDNASNTLGADDLQVVDILDFLDITLKPSGVETGPRVACEYVQH